MNITIPRSYQELLDQVSGYKNVQMPNPEAVLQNFGFKSLFLHAQAPVFYVVDYVQKKYLFIDPSCNTLLGYDVNNLMEAGPTEYTRLWHQSDYKIFNEQIIPEMIRFLKEQPHDTIQDYSFSFNYRISTKDGSFLTVLQRSTYYLATSDKIPLAAVGFIIDISHYKEDSKIVFTIERIDKNYNSLTKEPLHKSVFFPDKMPEVLSKREIQVLKCIYDGMSSKQIAEKLFVSLNTINSHRKNLLEKTNCQNTADLLRYAAKQGLL